ncbi:hypothetical protein SAMN05421748_102302 [Paractinoplanes atraurantiacus]|uniref:Uncharacterized protein n=1 Tax=Paractinoplanes atraurantiacus TaxID=1036182 RepID=A0A285GP87_9ACTN|nr:hypothetical protein SAMN05421748_102302 [Actinoplanes atraurantiacus]
MRAAATDSHGALHGHLSLGRPLHRPPSEAKVSSTGAWSAKRLRPQRRGRYSKDPASAMFCVLSAPVTRRMIRRAP